MSKFKMAGLMFLVCLAIGAGWALWIGLKVLAAIVGAGLAIGVAIGVYTSVRQSRRRLDGPPERSRLG